MSVGNGGDGKRGGGGGGSGGGRGDGKKVGVRKVGLGSVDG